jgi:hypothetical protein
MVFWDKVPYGKLVHIMEKRNKYSYREPFNNEIEYVNNVISYDYKGRTLTEMIKEFRQKGYDIKDFDFSLLSDNLASRSVKSYF